MQTLLFSILLFSCVNIFCAKVGLLVVATGKYISFVDPLINSAREHFLKNHDVTYFVFTDQPFTSSNDVIQIEQKRLGWPFDTMMRYHVYKANWQQLQTQDYLFACDADMLFVNTVGDEILGELVATKHPGFIHQRGSYETNKRSKAAVKPHEGTAYYAGGFYGASKSQFLKLLTTQVRNIDKDLSKKIIAVWHDESHWNRYLIDNPPTVVLSPSYCYPESWDLPYTRRLLALDKDHSAFRSND